MLSRTAHLFLITMLFIADPAVYGQQNLAINDFQVNENAGWCDHFDPQIAVQADGSFVIVWHDYKNIHADIFLQRFDQSLNRIGDNLLVNDDGGLNNQTKPDVDVDSYGRFVVAWMDERSGKSEIYAQRYDSLAHPLGNNFSVNEGVGGSSVYSNPSIAISSTGNFVITWVENNNNEYGIYARLYNHHGDDVTHIFKVNDRNDGVDQYATPVAGMDDAGNFVIVWDDLSQNAHRDIFAQRFNMQGVRLDENFKVNDDSNDRFHGSQSVSVFPDGNFVVAWIDERNYFYDIYAQRYDENGVPIADNFMVNDVADGQQITPIVCTSSSGRFVITWRDQREGGGEGGSVLFDIFSQIYDESGTPAGSNMKMRDDENSMYYMTPPTSDMDSTGSFMMAWNEKHIGNYQIFTQKFDAQGNCIGSPFQVNTDEGSGRQYNPVIGAADDGHFFVVWQDDRNGSADIYMQSYTSAGDPVGENYLVNDNDNTSKQSCPQMGIDAQGNGLIVWQDYRDGECTIYGQRFNSEGHAAGANFIINDNSPENGTWFPKIAMNQDGNCVVVWLESALAGMNFFAQRFDGDGHKVGDNFKVVDDEGTIHGLDFIYENRFAVGISDSNKYVVSWVDYHNEEYVISYKIYNSNGIPGKNIGRVNYDVPVHVFDYSMCMGSNGNFVISWVNWQNEGYDNLYAQLYDPSGNPVGENLLINNVPGCIYRFLPPTLSMDESGNFCIAWQDRRNGNFDIYGQLYSYKGQSIDTNFKINSNGDISSRTDPSIDLKNKKLYTSWEDNRIPGQGWDIFANVLALQEFSAVSNSKIQTNPDCLYPVQNYPNPFNSTTIIQYHLAKSTQVKLSIYNLVGQEIKVLLNGYQPAGNHQIAWTAAGLPGGIYFCRLLTHDPAAIAGQSFSETRKLILQK